VAEILHFVSSHELVFPITCPAEERAMANADLTLSSTAFAEGERIPRLHAYAPEGDNVSPPLSWDGVPPGTKELALIVDDPDAPRAEPWVHWVLYKIPTGVTEIPRNASQGSGQLTEPRGPLEGKNDFGELGWGGPLPPRGHGTHHYHFKLYALDEELAVGEGAAKPDLLQAMAGHVLGQAELVGTYSR
jgi:hypothetical protein